MIALLALPNTGSDWVAKTICKVNPTLKYHREFFNPICNQPMAKEIERAFGWECAPYNIARDVACLPLDDVKANTWDRTHLTFTKEVYSAFKVDWFVKHFRCIVVTRGVENTFPPRRENVPIFFQAMYTSLVRHKHSYPLLEPAISFVQATAKNVQQRNVGAFLIYTHQLLSSAARHTLPVLEWERLIKPEDGYFQRLEGLINTKGLAETFRKTAHYVPRKFPQKDFAERVREHLVS